MIITILKKLFEKKGEGKKESPMIQILDWGSSGCCFMNSCFYAIVILGILISIGVFGTIVDKAVGVLEKVGVISKISNIEKAAETVGSNPTIQKLIE